MNKDFHKDLWALALHEGGHALASIKLFPDAPVQACIGFDNDRNEFFGLCSGAQQFKTALIESAIFTAAGREATRFLQMIRPLPALQPKSTPVLDSREECSLPALPTEHGKLRRLVSQCVPDDVHLGQIVVELYPDYFEIRRWPRTHRRFRARAYLMLRSNMVELQRISTELYLERIFVYEPQASADGRVDI